MLELIADREFPDGLAMAAQHCCLNFGRCPVEVCAS
jgi:hypothetical protein